MQECDRKRGAHPAREEHKRLVSQISRTNYGFTGEFVANREYGNEALSQDRFEQKPIPRFAVAKEAQIQGSIQ
jgi:hypothetical protein